MRRKFKLSASLILVFVILTILGGCKPRVVEDTRPVAKGFIWEATSTKGEVVTLVGTMHPAPKTHILLNDKLKEVLNNSDVLTVEVDLTSASNMNSLQKSVYLKNGDNIENYLSSEEISKLSEILKPYKQNVDQIKNLNAYGINQVIMMNQLSEIGFGSGSTDTLLLTEAKKNKIEVDEIEGLDFQIKLLNDIYNWESLKGFINEYDDELKNKSLENTKKLFDNYVNSDVDLAEKLEASLRIEDEKLYEVLNIERNKGMANKIDELIKDGKKRVVAVGYRHYIGEDSVLDYLEEKGYTIKKIDVL